MTSPRLSVIVVNYNAGDHLAACLASLTEHLAPFDWDAVVIDNASTDGSEQVAAGDTRIALARNAVNAGFGRAVNQGAVLTTAPLMLFLNPDGQLLPGAVERLLAEFDAHPDCAVIGPAVVNDDGSIQGSGRGDPNMLTGLFGRSTLLTRLFPRARVARRNVVFEADPARGETSVEVDWVSGACMLVRRSAFDSVGGFDEKFFLYWEDADLCRRLRAAGWRTRYMPGARVAHSVGRSSRTAPYASIRAFHRSAYVYYVRYAAPSRWNPIRWFAFVLLQARCGLKLAEAGWRARSGRDGSS
ncbi:MAG: glycosyltransferase family 2 protein [Acidobacteria bacterium]|nr:glycosyltransferase family 2 protein [Acidobacteriota bacterium]